MSYTKSTLASAKRKNWFFSTRSLGLAFFFSTSLALAIMMLADWLGGRGFFAVEEITIRGNHFITDAQIESLTKISRIQNLLAADTGAIADLLNAHPMIGEATVKRWLPSSLTVEIVERHPVALINSTRLIPLDESGTLIEEAPVEMLHDYPIVSNIRLREQSVELKSILDFLLHLRRHEFTLYDQISEISYADDVGIYFYLTEGATVFWGTLDQKNKAENLQLVMQQVHAQGGNLSEIEYFDLRFKDQVVVKQRNQT